MMGNTTPVDESTDMAEAAQSLNDIADSNSLKPVVSALIERVGQLEEVVKTEREARRDDTHALARENKELRDNIEHHDNEIDRIDTSRGYIMDDVIDLENQLSDLEGSSTGSKGGGDDAESTLHRPDLTPIERVSVMDAEDTGIDMTPSIERAVTIFDHWEEWSEKAPKGRVLRDGLKTLLRTATGEQLAWRQVYRAAEALEELSKGRIQFIHHNRHGKMLIEPTTPERDCHASSAATG